MTQQEVLKFLKSKRKNKKWYSVQEIKKAMGIGHIYENIRKLKHAGMVKHKQEKKDDLRTRTLYKWNG